MQSSSSQVLLSILLFQITSYVRLAFATSIDKLLIPRDAPTLCTTSGLVPPPTSAVEETPEKFVESHASIELMRNSSIQCAMSAQIQEATAFSHKDNVCSLYGPGKGWKRNYYALYMPLNKDDLEEVAYNKPTFSSPKYSSGFDKSKAVDGNIGSWPEMYESAAVINPWWIVDLEETRKIQQLQIFTRQNCCYERFKNIEIRVGMTLITDGNLNSYKLMSTYEGPYDDTSLGHVICSHTDGFVGRYVSIQGLNDDGSHLQLVEVFVYALKV